LYDHRLASDGNFEGITPRTGTLPTRHHDSNDCSKENPKPDDADRWSTSETPCDVATSKEHRRNQYVGCGTMFAPSKKSRLVRIDD
jgi:hypothetical protein